MAKRGSKTKQVEGNPPNGGIVALTKELWQAAVTLRGSIEPADYKRYVLPIIFLRFLSLRYDRRRAELGKLIADKKSDYYRDKKALADPDEYRRVGACINIQLGNSYFDDKHATLKADYVLANPPFNDGSKGENGWGADKIADKDPRLTVGGQKLALSPRNANTMWMLHFLYASTRATACSPRCSQRALTALTGGRARFTMNSYGKN